MLAYDSCHHDDQCTCIKCRTMGRVTLGVGQTFATFKTPGWSITVGEPPTKEAVMRDALIDIAHDCGTLEAAQRRAKEALKGPQ